jgi:hypothetical protein
MEVRRDLVERPYFSICVPQYNRTSFLIEACRSLAGQSFRDFEVCISDDCSTDGKEDLLLAYLEDSGLSFVYRKQQKNTRYDGNLRASISLAQGDYCFLLGNDDYLATPTVLEDLHLQMQRLGPAEVVITNYEDFATQKQYRRITETGILGSGPRTAVAHYRSLSFVSGIVLHRQRSQELSTAKWDGSEMYQMYIGCRIIAAGGPLLGVEAICIRLAIRIPGEDVDSYASKPRVDPCPIVARPLPLVMMGGLVEDAIRPHLQKGDDPLVERIFWQILLFTYPFWIIEYRRVQSWNYAAGVCLGMRPARLLEKTRLDNVRRWRLSILFALVTLVGLLTPLWVFDWLHPKLYALAKSAYKR